MTANASLPLKCNRIDHYTLIVPDAKKVSDFHDKVLGYGFLKIKEVNAGSVPKGEIDMLNYIHEWPDGSGRILVITEGLTDDSIFRRFMNKFGQGIHHVALEVDDLQEAFDTLKAQGIKLTSDHIMLDMLSGLKQIFIDNENTGFFIELIERPEKDEEHSVDATQKGYFTHDNMAGLAGTMNNYIEGVKGGTTTNQDSLPELQEKVAGFEIKDFILEVEEPESTAAFFVDVLGFVQEESKDGGIQLYLPAEPKLRFHCRKRTGDRNEYALNASADTTAVLEKMPGAAVEQEGVAIPKEVSGYQIRVMKP